MRSRNVRWPFPWWWSESQPHGHNSVCERKWLLWTLFYRTDLKCKFPTGHCETESEGKETKQLSPVYEKKRMNWHKSGNKRAGNTLQYFVDGQLSISKHLLCPDSNSLAYTIIDLSKKMQVVQKGDNFLSFRGNMNLQNQQQHKVLKTLCRTDDSKKMMPGILKEVDEKRWK